MFSEDDSNRKPLKELCCSLLTLIIGFASCSVMSVLIYFTYETIIGNISYCTLWTDIPGRLAVFSTFYYAVAVCGILPIPESFRMNCLPQPFILYKLESWKRLFRNLGLLVTCFDCHAGEGRTDTETSPLRDGSNERYYDPHPILRRQSEQIPIANADKSSKFSGRLIKTERKEDVEIVNSSKEDSMSFDSSTDCIIVPRVKGKRTKPHYLPDFSTTESSGESGETHTPCELSTATLQNNEKTVSKLQSETGIQKISDVKTPLQSFPRFPWGLLKHKSGVPEEAKALHEKNLMIEKQELEKQKKEEIIGKESEHGWKTDRDPFTNRPLRHPIVPKRSKGGFRGRTKTTPGSISKFEKIDVPDHKRTISITAPHVIRGEATNINLEPEDSFGEKNRNKCRDGSTDLQSKVNRIQKTLRLGQSSQSGGNEASTSGQHSGISSSKNNKSDDISVQIDTSKKAEQ